MATRDTASTKIHTPAGIACFVYLHTPRARKDKDGNAKGDPKYQMSLFFDESTNLKAMKALAQRVGTEKFGPKFVDLVKKGKMNWPFEDVSDRDEDDRYPPFETTDGTLVGFKSKDKPGIVDADAEPLMDKADVYSGMVARASVRCFAYDNESKGVAFYLINVQKLEDGERISGDMKAEDDFKPAGKSKPKAKGKPTDDEEDELL
jgi:hypothetical protein